jgi:hypothetical protein
LWVEWQKCSANFQHRIETTLYSSKVCINGKPCQKIVAQVSLMKKVKLPVHISYRGKQ